MTAYLRRILMILIILVGICILTALLSVRSWYKPTIRLERISPITVIVEHDVKVADFMRTREKREAVRKLVLQDLGGRDTLKEDKKADRASLRNLEELIEICREYMGSNRLVSHLINPKISRETQDKLLAFSDSRYLDFTLALRNNKGKSLDLFALRELRELSNIELELYLRDLAKLREARLHAAMERDYLGAEFFEVLRYSDAEQIFQKARAVQKKLLSLGIVLGTPRNKINDNIRILYPELSSQEFFLISKLVERSTAPNIRINWKRLNDIENQAMSSVPKVMAELKTGQQLARKGERVEAREYFLLKELGLLHPRTDWSQIRSNFLLIASAVIFLALFFKLTKLRRFMVQEVHMFFIVTTSVIALIDLISLWGIDKLPLSPLATITILLTVFYAPYIAALPVTIIAFFLANSFDLNFWQVLPLYVGSIYAIFLARKAHQRQDLGNAGLQIAIVQVMVFGFSFLVAVGHFHIVTALSVAAMYALSGWLSGFLALAVLPYLESILGLLTPFKLAELANPNQPLLRKLREEAPGTYEHSQRVSRLSEEASNVLGTNTALIRTGLLYHDIGKTYKPDYFIENLFGKPNPHKTLDDPAESARIIIAHIPEGIKLARRHHLPQAIIDFIPMHQGTTITNYFYAKAVEKYGKHSVRIEDYRYPGPRPNSRETGIAMMADSAEAALKSMTDLREESAAKIMIDRIIQARLDEGELSDAGLSGEDLDRISRAFLTAWRAMNHERIKYPDKIGGTN